jgi:hypothetical protein
VKDVCACILYLSLLLQVGGKCGARSWKMRLRLRFGGGKGKSTGASMSVMARTEAAEHCFTDAGADDYGDDPPDVEGHDDEPGS